MDQNGRCAKVNVMLYIGSNTNFIREDLAKMLKLQGKYVAMNINGKFEKSFYSLIQLL